MSFASKLGTFSLTAVAAIAGTASCSAASLVAQSIPPQSEETFAGRYQQRLIAGDPYTLMFSNESVRELQAKKVESPEKLTELENRVVNSAVHPDTGEVVPQPFRMSGYVPYNGPLCAAMMLSKSTLGLVAGNWANQSHNALVNYFNRNASSSTDTTTLITSYLGAVGSAMTVAFVLGKVITQPHLLKFVAFPSSMIASSLNCYIMRRPEIDAGIDLLNAKGESILPEGMKSNVAARKAVYETVGSRSLLQIPVFLGPALILSAISGFLTKRPMLNTPMMTFVTMSCFGLGLPATVAVFPQTGSLNKTDVDPDLQQYISDDVVYYNKGL